MKRVFSVSTIMFVLCAFLVGCGTGGDTNNGESGNLSILVSESSNQVKTLEPDMDMDIDSYEIDGTGPSDDSFFITVSDGEQAIVEHLAPGNWTVSVNARNAENAVIGSGSASVTVIGGETAQATITVTPLNGNGTIDLTLQWDTVDIQTPVVDAELVPTEGAPVGLDFVISGSSATYTNNAVESGYYTLVVKVMDDAALVSGSVEVVRIVNGGTTSGTYAYTESDPDYGGIAVTITNEMGDPIEVTLDGQADEMDDDDTMVITASVPEGTGNVTYVWYIDGATVGTGSSFTVQDLAPGYYRLDVTAYTADGTRAGSTSHEFAVIDTGTVDIPAALYSIPCDEGSGTTLTDSITGSVLTGATSPMNWCSGTIKEQTDKPFIKSGANFSGAGVFDGDLIDAALNEYTVSFLTRITDDGQGAIIHFLGNGLHFRFWGGAWDIAGGITTSTDVVKRNVWTRVTYVQSATDQYIYVNRTLAAQGPGTSTISAGNVRIGGYTTTSYFYPGEYADIKIYDTALSQEQINQLCNNDGNDPEFALLSDGSDMGSIYKREEHSSVYDTNISVENDMYRHWFNGDSCWGAIGKLIPPGHESLWFSADFIYPTELTANHDFGTTAQTIALYEDFGRSNPIAILYLNHDETTNVLTLGSLSYRNTASGTVSIVLDGREITKDQSYRFEIFYRSGTSGRLEFYLDGELLHSVYDNFDLTVQQAMYGLNLGIHPESPGDVIYSDNVYVGVKRISEYLE